MIWLRSSVFNLFFFGVSAFLCILFLPALVMPANVLHFGFQLWANITAWLLKVCCGITDDIDTAPLPPGHSALYAGKHQSAWETLMLARVLDRPAFVLKRELLWIPILGWYMLKLRMIPIDRGAGSKALKSMINAAKHAAASGRDIVIFPEGTRVAPGKTGDYQPGVAALYARLDLPVVPFALNSGLCWPRKSFLKHPGHITLRFLEPIAPGMEKKPFLKSVENAIELETAQLELDVHSERAKNAVLGRSE